MPTLAFLVSEGINGIQSMCVCVHALLVVVVCGVRSQWVGMSMP